MIASSLFGKNLLCNEIEGSLRYEELVLVTFRACHANFLPVSIKLIGSKLPLSLEKKREGWDRRIEERAAVQRALKRVHPTQLQIAYIDGSCCLKYYLSALEHRKETADAACLHSGKMTSIEIGRSITDVIFGFLGTAIIAVERGEMNMVSETPAIFVG